MTPTLSNAVVEELVRLASDRDTPPAVRRLLAQLPAMYTFIERFTCGAGDGECAWAHEDATRAIWCRAARGILNSVTPTKGA